MKCYNCGTENPDVEGVSNFDPNVDKPPYVKPEKVLRQEARDSDWWFFRGLATFMGKGLTGNAWDQATVLKKMVLKESWPDFLLDKYGKDRGLDCTQPEPSKWEKQIHPDDWLLIRFKDNDAIVEAIIAYMD